MTAAYRPRRAERGPLITVCVPTIGRVDYLGETLDSLRRQSFTSYELLLLDNGSPLDASRQAAKLANAIPNARILRSETRMPMFANFNRGVREARGKYIAFFHDDDVYEPEFLSRMTTLLERNPDAAFAGSNYLVIDAKTRVTGFRRLVRRTQVQRGEDFIRDLVARWRNVIPTPGIVYRKSFFGHGFDEALSMHFGDFIILMRMAENHRVVLIAEPLMRIRLHGQNASNVPMSTAAPMQYEMIQRYIDEMEKRWPQRRIFARDLRALARVSVRRSLLFGALAASTQEESERCLDLLREHGGTGVVIAALKTLTATPSLHTLRRHVATAFRRIAHSVG
jgi:glycosyltransferase involved in cell wall biosynthesis